MTLVEMLMALAIFAVVGSSILFALNASTKTVASSSEITTAESLTRSVIEYIKRSDYISARYPTDPGPAKVKVLLNGNISDGATTINLDIDDLDSEDGEFYNDLDDLAFPESGVIQIEEELIYYASRDGTSVTVSQRGYFGTEAAGHNDDKPVIFSPLYYDDTVYANIYEAAVEILDALEAGPYYGDYTVEAGILRLDPQVDLYGNDDGLQKIYVSVSYMGKVPLITQDYKVKR